MQKLKFQCCLRTIRENVKDRTTWSGRLADIDNVIVITFYDDAGELHRVGFLASDEIDTSGKYGVTLSNPLIFEKNGNAHTGHGQITIDYDFIIKLSNDYMTLYL